ncbi:MAG TPA: transcriptional repressor [Gemmatimonadota bacterium]|nr:transcriptional repressor [Gemmatimonadota bacterium]
MTTTSRQDRQCDELEAELREALEADGHRFTAQRSAVYSVLGSTSSHPTADEIFTSVRETIPDISLATVYKALEAFVSCGLARKLSMGEGPARYDGRTEEHEHVRCLSCGRVADIDDVNLSSWLDSVARKTDFQIVSYRLELLGHCSRCRN